MNGDKIRYRQLDYSMGDEYQDELKGWDIPGAGSGPTSIAMILSNYGLEKSPVEIAKKIFVNKEGEFDGTYVRSRGIRHAGLIYCLDRLIEEDGLDIEYEVVKINFDNPLEQKDQIVKNLRDGTMAIVHVGPKDGYEEFQGTFSKNGHYVVVSDVDDDENFYVLNPNKVGDEQVEVPFAYDDLVREIYGREESFNFLFIRRAKGAWDCLGEGAKED